MGGVGLLREGWGCYGRGGPATGGVGLLREGWGCYGRGGALWEGWGCYGRGGAATGGVGLYGRGGALWEGLRTVMSFCVTTSSATEALYWLLEGT